MNKALVITMVVTVGLVALFIWGNSVKTNNIVMFQDTEVACLSSGHQRVVEHIHPTLSITVDGEPEVIPQDVGIEEGCMSELHTHDASGVLHVESAMFGRIETLNIGHFFSVWGKDIEKEGYDLEIIQDGEVKESVEDVKFIDRSSIEFKYTSKGE